MGDWLSASDHARVSATRSPPPKRAPRARSSPSWPTARTATATSRSPGRRWSRSPRSPCFALFPGLLPRPCSNGSLGGWNHEWTHRELLGIATAVAMLKFLATWLLLHWQPLRFALIPGPIKTRPRPRPRDRLVQGRRRAAHAWAHRHPHLPVDARAPRRDRRRRGDRLQSPARDLGRGDGGDAGRDQAGPLRRRDDRRGRAESARCSPSISRAPRMTSTSCQTA